MAAMLRGQDAASAAPADWFEIEVVDGATKRGVPLIALRTVNQVRYWTDSRARGLPRTGHDEPRRVRLRGRGRLRLPKDGFGNAGLRLHPVPGGSHRIEVRRTDIAERLYRVTGEGITGIPSWLGIPSPFVSRC